jgi:hypothetical protein
MQNISVLPLVNDEHGFVGLLKVGVVGEEDLEFCFAILVGDSFS